MDNLKFEQLDLDVLVKENNEPIIINLATIENLSDDWINIELRDESEVLYGSFKLNKSIDMNQLQKVFMSLMAYGESLKQEKIDGYVPRTNIMKLF